eukprot:ctg_858.g372
MKGESDGVLRELEPVRLDDVEGVAAEPQWGFSPVTPTTPDTPTNLKAKEWSGDSSEDRIVKDEKGDVPTEASPKRRCELGGPLANALGSSLGFLVIGYLTGVTSIINVPRRLCHQVWRAGGAGAVRTAVRLDIAQGGHAAHRSHPHHRSDPVGGVVWCQWLRQRHVLDDHRHVRVCGRRHRRRVSGGGGHHHGGQPPHQRQNARSAHGLSHLGLAHDRHQLVHHCDDHPAEHHRHSSAERHGAGMARCPGFAGYTGGGGADVALVDAGAGSVQGVSRPAAHADGVHIVGEAVLHPGRFPRFVVSGLFRAQAGAPIRIRRGHDRRPLDGCSVPLLGQCSGRLHRAVLRASLSGDVCQGGDAGDGGRGVPHRRTRLCVGILTGFGYAGGIVGVEVFNPIVNAFSTKADGFRADYLINGGAAALAIVTSFFLTTETRKRVLEEN